MEGTVVVGRFARAKKAGPDRAVKQVFLKLVAILIWKHFDIYISLKFKLFANNLALMEEFVLPRVNAHVQTNTKEQNVKKVFL